MAKTWLLPCLVTCILTCLLACLLTFLYTCLHRRQNCPVIAVKCDCLKSQTSHPPNCHQLNLLNLNFMIYLPRLVGSPLSRATSSYHLPPKIIKQHIYQLSTDHIWPISSCISTFLSGWLGVGVGVGSGNNQT